MAADHGARRRRRGRQPGVPPRTSRNLELVFVLSLVLVVAAAGWWSVLVQLGLAERPGILGPLGGATREASPVAVQRTPTATASPISPTAALRVEPTASVTVTIETLTPTAVPTASPEPSPTATPPPTPLPTETPPRPTATEVPPTPTTAPTAAPVVARHVVGPGETLASIAARYGVDPTTLAVANRLQATEALLVGRTLYVTRVSGIVHVVAPGESLMAIARLYGVSAEAIAAANQLADPGSIVVGQPLVIPGARAPVPAPTTPPQIPRPASPPPANFPVLPRAQPTVSGAITVGLRGGSPVGGPGRAAMLWPSRGAVSQSYGENGHTGIDIMGNTGDAVVAAAAGLVTVALPSDFGYGWRIEIDHGGGLSSLYGHLNAITVQVGDRVTRGQRIGAVGTTGVSTGPHLHFEVRQRGLPTDPLAMLP